MPQTKHAFVALVVLTVATIAGAAFVVKDSIGVVASFMEPQTALLIQSEELEHGVEVFRDTTREDARASLMKKLKAYVGETEPVDGQGEAEGETVSVSTDTDSVVAIKAPSASSILCDPNAPPVALPDWGPVNVTIGEGARVITSLATNATNEAMNVLQLPLTPIVTGVTACLSSGMVAVTLDGKVLSAGESIETPMDGLIGYAIDGFPLFSPYEDSRELTSDDLDVCHGHVHMIVDQGIPTPLYHYHVTTDDPYTLGCFRGTPVFE